MILTDTDLQQLCAANPPLVSPLDPTQIGPASIDLRFGDTVLRHADGISQGIDISKANPVDPYYLKPHQTLLVRTRETLKIPNDCAGIIRLKSSIAREGILLAGAEFFDPGFQGVATLSIFNAAALHFAIWPERRFCQLILHQTKGDVAKPYQGKYQGATDVVGSLENYTLGDRVEHILQALQRDPTAL